MWNIYILGYFLNFLMIYEFNSLLGASYEFQ